MRMKHTLANGHQWAICREKIPQNAHGSCHTMRRFFVIFSQHHASLMTVLGLLRQVMNRYYFLFLFVFIAGCASSDFSRGSAGEVDKAYLSADYAWNHSDGSLTDSYQNSSQTAN